MRESEEVSRATWKRWQLLTRLVMNARMRRIDLFCKLMGPLTISLVALASTLIAIRVTLAMNVASVLVEYICIAQVSCSQPYLYICLFCRCIKDSLNSAETKPSASKGPSMMPHNDLLRPQ